MFLRLLALLFVYDAQFLLILRKFRIIALHKKAARAFIANWESEKYRKSLAGKK